MVGAGSCFGPAHLQLGRRHLQASKGVGGRPVLSCAWRWKVFGRLPFSANGLPVHFKEVIAVAFETM